MAVSLFHFRARTSDLSASTARGAALLAELLEQRLGVRASAIGEPSEPHTGAFAEDLEACSDDLADLADAVRPVLERGDRVVVTGGHCPVCLGTLPTVCATRPDAKVLWLDAHGDLNLPSTTPSNFLGGMCLAGAMGGWDAGVARPIPEASVVLAGVRDLDPGEREYLAATAASLVPAGPDVLQQTVRALDGAPAFVHLDGDVLDNSIIQAEFPAPGGLTERQLTDTTTEVAERSEVVGVELTSFPAPADAGAALSQAELLMRSAEPLVERLAA